MSNLFVCFSGNDFSIHYSVSPDMVYCLDIDSFFESCASGHACAMSVNVFNDEITDFKLLQIDNRYSGLLSYDDFHNTLVLSHKASLCVLEVI